MKNWQKQTKRITLAGAVMVAFVCGLERDASTHGGRTNSQGCHNNRKTGGYHCHGGGSRSNSSRSSSRSHGGSSASTRPKKPTRAEMGVTVIPKAAIYIDGEYVGVSPVKNHRFEKNQREFELRIVHPLLGQHTRTLEVEHNTQMNVRWSP